MTRLILTLNAGSSSIKLALFAPGDPPEPRARGAVEGIGGQARLALDIPGAAPEDRALAAGADHRAALDALIETVEARLSGATIAAVGHRIVHGGPDFAEPVRLDDAVLERLAALTPFAPLHQPHNLAGVRAARAAFPHAAQIGCFDTAFHRHHPWVNDTFALPREYYRRGIRRYGFHGLSYDHVARALARIAPDASRAVIAHLGNGASMAAIRDGRSVGSTMGLTALDGLPMGTRCGQIDPGVILYLLQGEGMAVAEVTDLLYRRSGLLGLSGLSNDMATLEAAGTREAEEAIAYFVFRVRRELGAMAAVLGGLDALVFTGGIGENSARVRAEVCAGLGWLGIALDAARNDAGEGAISADDSRVGVHVIPTDEELTIARGVTALLDP